MQAAKIPRFYKLWKTCNINIKKMKSLRLGFKLTEQKVYRMFSRSSDKSKFS